MAKEHAIKMMKADGRTASMSRFKTASYCISAITMNITGAQWIRILQIFSAKFVLEVLGAAGAIWGSSEAAALRTSSNIWFWRPLALSVGIIFFCRWLLQIKDFISEFSKETRKEGFSSLTESEDEGLTLQEETSHAHDGVFSIANDVS